MNEGLRDQIIELAAFMTPRREIAGLLCVPLSQVDRVLKKWRRAEFSHCLRDRKPPARLIDREIIEGRPAA